NDALRVLGHFLLELHESAALQRDDRGDDQAAQGRCQADERDALETHSIHGRKLASDRRPDTLMRSNNRGMSQCYGGNTAAISPSRSPQRIVGVNRQRRTFLLRSTAVSLGFLLAAVLHRAAADADPMAAHRSATLAELVTPIALLPDVVAAQVL